MVDQMKQLLELEDILWITGVLAAAFATVVQKLSKKYKPWTWLVQQFGKIANKEMLDKLDSLEKKVDKLEQRDAAQDALFELEQVKAARRRILKFADEIRMKEKHSEEYFNDVLGDISFYKQYCLDNPKFQNEKAVIAMRLIEKAYEKCVQDNDFL